MVEIVPCSNQRLWRCTMLPKLHVVQRVHLPCDVVDLETLTVDCHRGLIEKSALRSFLGNRLLRQVLHLCHGIEPQFLDTVQAKLQWRVRLLDQPSRISISYWVKRDGSQPRRYRLLFRSEHVPGRGYTLTLQGFRHGDSC